MPETNDVREAWERVRYYFASRSKKQLRTERDAWKRWCVEAEEMLASLNREYSNPRFSPERVELLEAMKRAADARDWDTFVEVGVVLTEHDRTHGIGGDGE